MKKLILLAALILMTGLTYGQTLQKNAVVAVNSYIIALQPGVTMNQFLDFYINKYIPEYEKNYPGVKQYVIWGDRGEKKFQIGIMEVYESVAVRDKFYPTEGSEGSDIAKAAAAKMKAMDDESNKYVLGGTRTYTDWIIK